MAGRRSVGTAATPLDCPPLEPEKQPANMRVPGLSDWHIKRNRAAEYAQQIVPSYLAGLSANQVAAKFSVTAKTVLNILKRENIPPRSRAAANALRWVEPKFRANQVEKRRGKPTWSKGQTWTIGRPVFKPSIRGEGNPNWKGGRLTLALQIRRLGQYKIWRSAVFTRDNFTCRECGVGGTRIEADHIIPFSKIMDDFSIDSVDGAIACNPLWDVENGRTLCKPCHRKTPTFGSKWRTMIAM